MSRHLSQLDAFLNNRPTPSSLNLLVSTLSPHFHFKVSVLQGAWTFGSNLEQVMHLLLGIEVTLRGLEPLPSGAELGAVTSASSAWWKIIRYLPKGINCCLKILVGKKKTPWVEAGKT